MFDGWSINQLVPCIVPNGFQILVTKPKKQIYNHLAITNQDGQNNRSRFQLRLFLA